MADVLKTLIVDDEPLAIERLRAICDALAGVTPIAEAGDGAEALERAREHRPDLVLLDMTMPGENGLAVARELATLDPPPAVIFVTAHENFAVEAFDVQAVDYVLKPVAPERLERAIARAAERRSVQDTEGEDRWLRELWVPRRSELVRVPVAEIHRIDAERDYVRLHVGEQTYLLLQTIAGLEERLDPDAFLRIHRSTIVAKRAIAGLRHDGLGVWSVELEDGALLRIGRTYLARVKALAGR